MADNGPKPLKWPAGGSLFGRLVKMCVLAAGPSSVIGMTAGGIANGTAGAMAGATIGAGVGILGFGVIKAVKDKKAWKNAQWDRAAQYTMDLQAWKDGGRQGDEPQPLPNEERRKRFRRRMKNVLGMAAGGVTLGALGLLPAMTALPALGFWAAAMGASYVVTRLLYRPKRPDFAAIRASILGPDPEHHPELERSEDNPKPRNASRTVSLNDARQVRRPGGGVVQRQAA